jgi:23S rRNA (cytidine2498-2'-O)-methyltransferase
MGRVGLPAGTVLDTVLDAIIDVWIDSPVPIPEAVALQVWASGPVEGDFRTDELRRELEEALVEDGIQVGRAGMAQVLSVCLSSDTILLGLNGAANALSDWPGGRVRLAKPKGQISRSEFKLEELFRTTGLQPPRGGLALDLGASPGGWTRILRGYGLDVVAVDPADLDQRLRGDTHIRHVRATASPFLAQTREQFDIIVNDMRMESAMSVGLMVRAAAHLKPGGLMIMTLKLASRDAERVVRDAIARLGAVVDVELARQLHHNRDEVTIVARKPST